MRSGKDEYVVHRADTAHGKPTGSPPVERSYSFSIARLSVRVSAWVLATNIICPTREFNAVMRSGICAKWNVYRRLGIMVDSATFNITHDADNLPCRVFRAGPDPLADDQLTGERIALWPELARRCHRGH